MPLHHLLCRSKPSPFWRSGHPMFSVGPRILYTAIHHTQIPIQHDTHIPHFESKRQHSIAGFMFDFTLCAHIRVVAT
jgi:hypothetical protein